VSASPKVPHLALPLVLLAALAAAASPAAAQWTRITQVPASIFYSVWVNGDTIAAGADSIVYVSTDAGVTWKGSAVVAPGAFEVRVRERDRRLYAATRGQGIFVSDDFGSTWASYNQGLVGGFANSQLRIIDLVMRGDSLYLATEGAGAWVRNLKAGTWTPFGSAFGPAQATNMTAIAAGGSRLWAAGGFNGTVFYRDPGDTDWTLSLLFNDRFAPGLAALTAIYTGTRWVVGANNGAYWSTTGQEPWTFVDPGAGNPLFTVSFAQRGHDLFANFGAFSSTLMVSHDDGSSWDLIETLPIPVPSLAIFHDTLLVGRIDGLWRRSLDDVLTSVPPPRETRLRFAIVGAQPVRDAVRFRFELPAGGRAAIDVFDVAGRRVASPIDGPCAAGRSEVTWSTHALAPGIYEARLRNAGQTETVRLVRVP